jgi:hypothetical protein
MIRTLVFNIESISDMQKILKLQYQYGKKPTQVKQNSAQNSTSNQNEIKKRSLVEDFAAKYTNIKVRKISPVKSSSVIIEEIPKSPKKKVVEIIQQTVLKPPQQNSPKKTETNSVRKYEASPQKKVELQRSFMCITCSQKFSNFDQLKNHLKTCQSSSTSSNFKCFCGKVLKSKNDLSNHVSIIHKQNKQLHLCIVCKKTFSSLFSLQNHAEVAHKLTQGALKGVYTCHICNGKFVDHAALKEHQLSCKKKTIES